MGGSEDRGDGTVSVSGTDDGSSLDALVLLLDQCTGPDGQVDEDRYRGAVAELASGKQPVQMSLDEGGLLPSIADAIREKVEALAGKAFPPIS